jgi:MFS family permease
VSRPTAESIELSNELTGRPTRVRYGVLAFLCSLCFVLYLDRLCMGVAKVPMQEQLGFTNTQLGMIDLAFMISYAVFEMPVGNWGDRFGSRGVLTRIVLCWSVFTALTGATSSLWPLLAVRFLFGAGEAGAFPNAARVLTRWFPGGPGRVRAQSMVTAFAQLGGAVSPIMAGYISEWFGWRWSFAFFGAVGVVWAVAFYLWFRDNPAEHPGVNSAELKLLATSAPAANYEQHPPLPWRSILTNANVWLLGIAMNCGAATFYMCVYWFPKYLKAARGVELVSSGWLSSLINVGGAIGCIAGAFISNWLIERIPDIRSVRRLVGGGGFAAAAFCVFMIVHSDSPVTASVFSGLAIMCGQIQITSWWAVTAEISGKHQAALFGLMNSMGGIGGGLSPYFFGWFGDWMGSRGHTGRDQWDPAFYVYVGVYLVGAVCWKFIDVNKPVKDLPAVDAANGDSATSTV